MGTRVMAADFQEGNRQVVQNPGVWNPCWILGLSEVSSGLQEVEEAVPGSAAPRVPALCHCFLPLLPQITLVGAACPASATRGAPPPHPLESVGAARQLAANHQPCATTAAPSSHGRLLSESLRRVVAVSTC